MAHRLVLIRHAKAQQGHPDRSRTLSGRGQVDAEALGRWLRAHDLVPDRAVLSPATRTVQTWAAVGVGLGVEVDADEDERVWDNTLEDLVALIEEQEADVTTLAVVGHNPSMHALAARLAADASADVSEFPTATVAVFTVDNWLNLESAKLVAVETCRG